MLEKYFSAPKTLRRLRGGISGPYVDAFADDLNRDGYARPVPFAIFEPPHISAASFNEEAAFWRTSISTYLILLAGHLRRCRCPHFRRGKISYHAHFGVKLFHHHLVEHGICKSQPVQEAPLLQLL
jgi:hypothetical protein